MTWWHGENGYEVFFNRDELKTRPRALPPGPMISEAGVRYLAPIDPHAGGSWMFANEHGLTVCLLNRWHQGALAGNSAESDDSRSRGLLVLGFAEAATAGEVFTWLDELDCALYRPFTLVAIDKEGAMAKAWDGRQLLDEAAEAPLTSSSYCFEEVKKSRRDRYQELEGPSPESLHKYQAGELPCSAYTVRMNRPDAQTWSRSRLSVGPEHISWQYLEELPDLVEESIEHNTKLELSL